MANFGKKSLKNSGRIIPGLSAKGTMNDSEVTARIFTNYLIDEATEDTQRVFSTGIENSDYLPITI